jgi:uncharacterized protein YndB with AHSA1/START domain
MSISEINAVVREIRIDAKPETVYAYFVDPEKMRRWKGTNVTLDPRPGGVYAVDINALARARGEYVELVPYSRIVFTWGWEGEGVAVPPGSTRVEVDLLPDGDGTLLRLVHRGLPTQHESEQHTHGWGHFLSRLAIAAAGGDPGPDPMAQTPTS